MTLARAWLLVLWAIAAFGCGEGGGGDGKKDAGAQGEAGSRELSDSGWMKADGAIGSAGRAGNHSQSGPGGSGGQDGAQGGADAQTVEDSEVTALDGGTTPPTPVEIDLTGLVPTSGRNFVFYASDFRTIQVVDVETGTAHDLNPLGADVSYTVHSPDCTTLLFSGPNAASDQNLYLARFTADGFVPGKLVEGFEDMPANHYAILSSRSGTKGWNDNQRFVGLLRGSNLIGDGLDIVDTWKNQRHFTYDGDMTATSPGMDFAPKGDWFHVGITENDVPRRSYARLTDDGSSDPITLPETQFVDSFTHDGKRMICAELPQSEQGERRYFVRDPESGVDFDLNTAVAGEQLITVIGYPPYAEEVWGSYSLVGEDQHKVYRRIALDGSAAPVAISDPARRLKTGLHTRDGSTTLFVYTGDTQLELEVADGEGGRRQEWMQFPLDTSLKLGGYGDHFLYYYPDPGDLHVVGRNGDGAVVDTIVSTAGEDGYGCLGTLGTDQLANDKLAYLASGIHMLVMVDLGGEVPERVGTFTPQHGGRFYCPIWNPQGDAFVLVEHDGDVGNTFYIVDWPQGGPATPREFQQNDYDIYGTVMLTR